MNRLTTLSNALTLVGVALLVAPALSPVPLVLYHDTHPGAVENGTALERQGYTVVAYENLSDRGKELYVQTLRNNGRQFVPAGTGAPEFSYATPAELGDTGGYRGMMVEQSIVVERPPDADLPPADEPVYRADHPEEDDDRPEEHEDRPSSGDDRASSDGGRASSDDDQASGDEMSAAERRRQITRYDVMRTWADRPPLDATSGLVRLLSVVGGVLALGTGGYLGSKP